MQSRNKTLSHGSQKVYYLNKLYVKEGISFQVRQVKVIWKCC